MPGATSSTCPGGRSNVLSNGMSSAMRGALLHRDLADLDDLFPLRGLVLDQLGEVRRGTTDLDAAEIGEPRRDLLILQRRVDLAIEPLDDGGRRALRDRHAEERARL